MSDKKKGSGSFLLQGSILAAASIISRVIGLLYRIPLTNILGRIGNDFYSTAFDAYSIVLIISSFSLPLAVSKLVSARMAKGQVCNAWRIVKGALIFAVISGGAAALLLFFGANFFTGTLLKTPMAAMALRVLAPTVFIVALVGVLRGFFQGLGTMVPSAFSQIAEQIVNAIVSVAAAWILFAQGAKIGAVLNQPNLGEAYAASGGTLGTSMGAVTALLFMGFLFFAYRPRFTKRMEKDKDLRAESASQIASALFLTIIPVLLSTTLYNAVNILDQFLFKHIANALAVNATQISEWWGTYTGEVVVIQNIPLGIASAIGASAVPSLTASFNSGKRSRTSAQIQSALRFIMLIAAPCAVGIFALAQPILLLLYHDPDITARNLLLTSIAIVPVFTVSTLTNSLLQGIDKMRLPVIHAAAALGVQAVVLVVCMYVFHMGIFAVPAANACYGLVMCILNGVALRRYGHVKIRWMSVYGMPAICSAIMGAVVSFVYHLIQTVIAFNPVSTIVSIIAGVLVYALLLLVTGTITEADLRRVPMGGRLIPLVRRFRREDHGEE